MSKKVQDVVKFQMTGNGPMMISQSAINPDDGTGVNIDGQPAFTGQKFFNPDPGNIGTLQRRMFDSPWLFNVDVSLMKEFKIGERGTLVPFVEFFNLLNRQNPGNNYAGDVAGLPIPVNDTANVTALCLNPACTASKPVRSINDLRVPAGALGDFFGLGTTVGIPFAAQLGVRFRF